MRCVIIHGSPRRGNTWNVLNMVLDELRDIPNIEFDIIELGKIKLDTCIGCFNCIIKGEDRCPHNSDMKILRDKIEDAEVIIMTSPVYSMQVSGLLKNFIDHMSFKFHRPGYYKKKGLVIATTAGAGHKNATKYMKEVLAFWGINKVNSIAVAYRSKELTEKNIDYIKNEARKFKRELIKGDIPKSGFKQIIMYNAWRAMSSNDKSMEADYNYYKNNRGAYYGDANVNKIKIIIGNLVYKVIKRG